VLQVCPRFVANFAIQSIAFRLEFEVILHLFLFSLVINTVMIMIIVRQDNNNNRNNNNGNKYARML